MVITQFKVYMTPRCLEWLDYLIEEFDGDDSDLPRKITVKVDEDFHTALIRPDENSSGTSMVLAVMQLSWCCEAIRFTYPGDGTDFEELEIGGELAQNIFALVAPRVLEVSGEMPEWFIQRHPAISFIDTSIDMEASRFLAQFK